MSAAGDINGDGIDDLIIGANGADPNGSGSGASYVVFGSRTAFAANLNLSTLNGVNGFKISGVTTIDQSGRSVSAAGDINGDGIADILFQNNAGQVAVWSMSATGAVTTSAYLYSGSLGDWRLKASADINSDGNADLIFQNSAGQIAVWYMNGPRAPLISPPQPSASGSWHVPWTSTATGTPI